MDIIVAENAGACYGVNRSLEIVEQASRSGNKIATLGDLIHNPIVVKELRDKYNIFSVDGVNSAKNHDVDTIIIRSHGVPIDQIENAKKLGLEVIDATCPHVKNVQVTAKNLAEIYSAVILVGKSGHPEVESVSSYVKAAGAMCFVGQSKEEFDSILPQLKKINSKIGVVSQTTQSLDVFNEMINYLETNGLELDIKNTICAATKKRQNYAIDLSKHVDAMIVLGGKNSSNTNHLADLCKKSAKLVFHIEDPKELNISDFQTIKTLGITAGASTPKTQINNLLSFLNCHFSHFG